MAAQDAEQSVLILVVMDDALVLDLDKAKLLTLSRVLILVVMDDALVQRHTSHYVGKGRVLILVVMDDALVLFFSSSPLLNPYSLNPCCNG